MVLLAADGPALAQATGVAQQVGLLTNDALIVTLMRRRGLTHLVTNDDDFDAVRNLTLWKPR
jgi:predicted nucleic acid-binding protein